MNERKASNLKNAFVKSTFAFLIGTFTLLLFYTSSVFAVPACPFPTDVKQANGSVITITGHGDEFFNWSEDKDGYVIAYDGTSKNWEYAVVKDGAIQPGGEVVTPSSALSNLSGSAGQVSGRIKSDSLQPLIQQAVSARPDYTQNVSNPLKNLSGSATAAQNVKLLVLLFDFNDVHIAKTEADWNKEIFSTTSTDKSVVNYYKDQSGGLNIFTIADTTTTIAADSTETLPYYNYVSGVSSNVAVTVKKSTLPGVIKVQFSMNHPNPTWPTTVPPDPYQNNSFSTIDLAIKAIQDKYPSFSFSSLGSGMKILAVFAGSEVSGGGNSTGQTWACSEVNGGKAIFGEMYDKNNALGVGTFCHELGHTLGLPDLYDTTYSSWGVGPFSLMSFGSWGTTQSDTAYNGQTPVGLDAWSRIYLGYATPTVITSAQYWNNSINSHVTTNKNDANILKVTNTGVNSTQYFLIENRELNGYDAGMWGLGYGVGQNKNLGGITVYHVDDSIFNNANKLHKVVDVEEADGVTLLDKYGIFGPSYTATTDFFFRSDNHYLFNGTTTPNTNFYDTSSTSYPQNKVTGVQMKVNSTYGQSMQVQFGVPTTYIVAFNANGGTGTMANQNFTYDTAQALTANAFTRTGYTFQGWATTATGAVAYTNSQSVSNLTTVNGTTVTLYAVWKANTYIVAFNANGGIGTMANQNFTYGTAQALTANAFTRTGYTFQGWSTSSTATAATYTNGQSVSNLTATNGATVTLYAVWQANTYIVAFNANGGTGTMANQNFTYGTAQALTANAFTRTGYTLQGWATTATGTVAYTNGQSVSNLTATNGATVTLYAVWQAVPNVPVTGVTLNAAELSASVGGIFTFVATVSPDNATNKAVTWSSSNTAVVTVDSAGKMTAVGGGTATVTVKTVDGGKTASCNCNITSFTTGVTLNKTTDTLIVGGTDTLVATVAPADATNKTVTWSSSNTAVATVDANGKVTAVAAGTATITVKTNDTAKTATCAVTVNKATVPVTGVTLNTTTLGMGIAATYTLVATISPANATNKAVTWTTSNNLVATVDANGVVKYVGPGTTVITVTTADGGKTATCNTSVSAMQPTATVRRISATYMNSAYANSDGTVWTWGWNAYGQLGNGTTTDSSVPVQVSGLKNFISVSSGQYFTTALKTDGTVWAWGYNVNGELGNGTTTNSLVPVQVKGLTGVTSIYSGYNHTIALKSDGTVWAWGENANGELGNGTTTNSSVPVQVKGLTGVTSIYTIYCHCLALKSDGTLWAWGWNGCGQLGNGTTVSSSIPVQVSGLSGVVSISTGMYHSIVSKSDGTVWVWGDNSYGQVGNGTITGFSAPVQVKGLTGVASISGGGTYTVALKSDGTVWAWGYNGFGQLGNGTTTSSSVPVQVSGLSGVASIYAGVYHFLAIKTDRTVWSCGYNDSGQLGNGTTTNSSVPVQVKFSASVNAGPIAPAMPDTGLALDKTSITLNIGDTDTLTATAPLSDGTDNSLIWSSSDESVATVDSAGIVTAVGAGTATITVSTADGAETASCAVTVNAADADITTDINTDVSPTAVTINLPSTTLKKGNAETLTATVSPSDATDASVTWSSSNVSVATIDENGTVTALKTGTVRITATASNGVSSMVLILITA